MTGISGYIYVLWPGNDSTGQVLKVGRADIIERRMKTYPQGTKLIRSYLVDDHIKVEKDLLRHLKAAYTVNAHYGSEYFTCPDNAAFITDVDKFMLGRLPSDMHSKFVTADIHATVLDIVATHSHDLAGKTIEKFHECKKWGIQNYSQQTAATVIKRILSRMLGVVITGKHVSKRDSFLFPQDLDERLVKARQFHQWFRVNFRVTNQTRDVLRLADVVALYADDHGLYHHHAFGDIQKTVSTLLKAYMIALTAGSIFGLVCVTELPKAPAAVRMRKYAKTLGHTPTAHLPFCPELIVTHGQYRGLMDEANVPSDTVIVQTETGPLHVPGHILREAQCFTYRLAHELFRIQTPVDARFYETFIRNACCPMARSRALEFYHKWRRFTHVKHLMQNRMALDLPCVSEEGLSRDQIKDRLQLYYGNQLLLHLCPTGAEATVLFDEYHWAVRNEVFAERMGAYLGDMETDTYRAIVDSFGFEKYRHGSKSCSTKTPNAVTAFCQKVLYDAFGIKLTKDGNRRKKVSAQTWKFLSMYCSDEKRRDVHPVAR